MSKEAESTAVTPPSPDPSIVLPPPPPLPPLAPFSSSSVCGRSRSSHRSKRRWMAWPTWCTTSTQTCRGRRRGERESLKHYSFIRRSAKRYCSTGEEFSFEGLWISAWKRRREVVSLFCISKKENSLKRTFNWTLWWWGFIILLLILFTYSLPKGLAQSKTKINEQLLLFYSLYSPLIA